MAARRQTTSDMDKTYTALKRRLTNRTATIGVMGLGYVGLPLAAEFASQQFTVWGIDANIERVHGVSRGVSHIPDVSSDQLQQLVRADQLHAISDVAQLAQCDVVIICVPTPLRKTREPDISYIVAATSSVAKYLHRGQLIVLESTTYPGTTQEMVQPLLEEHGLVVGRDIFLAFSPERVDPGNQQYTTKNIPKVVGGVTARCTELAQALYAHIVTEVVPVSSPKAAEMVKLLENTFRSINIALANEMALMCDKMGVNVWEVIAAAKTKPFGFMAFYPGPGLGGHCIPSDPIYLSWKARMHGYEARLIELAAQINSYMPHHVLDKVTELLNRQGKAVQRARLLLLGMAYKRDVGDTRDSPALEILHLLRKRGAQIQYHDPYVPTLPVGEQETLSSVEITPAMLHATDCVLLITDHSAFDYGMIAQEASLILDTRNRFAKEDGGRAAIHTL